MKATLKVKNFGPIKDVELDLRDVNVFIGPQASGKSVLAKLYTICKSPLMYHDISQVNVSIFNNDTSASLTTRIEYFQSSIKFNNTIRKYSLESFFNSDTEIEFSCFEYYFSFKNNKILFEDKLGFSEFSKSNFISEDNQSFDDWFERAHNISSFLNRFSHFDQSKSGSDRMNRSYTKMSLFEKIEVFDTFKISIYENTCFYIPSERTLAVLLKKAALNLMLQKVPIPEHLLEFAANYNSASDKVKKLDLSYLKSTANYQNIDGEDFIQDDGTTLKLSESASGLQSVVPLLITLEHLRNDKDENKFHQAFVIEEPETNLFPKAQYALLKYLEKSRPDDDGKIDTGSVHIYTTHSPFILSSLNNMLYAYKKGNKAAANVQEEIAKILPQENWISPERFSAYQIVDGKAESIFDRESGLIQENIIDQISEDIIEDFRSIAIATMDE